MVEAGRGCSGNVWFHCQFSVEKHSKKTGCSCLLVPNVLFLPIAFMLASGRSDACMSLPLASAATLILLLVWSGRLAELGRGPVVAFRRAIPLFIAAAWAWPVLLLLGPFVFPVWRLLTSP